MFLVQRPFRDFNSFRVRIFISHMYITHTQQLTFQNCNCKLGNPFSIFPAVRFQAELEGEKLGRHMLPEAHLDLVSVLVDIGCTREGFQWTRKRRCMQGGCKVCTLSNLQVLFDLPLTEKLDIWLGITVRHVTETTRNLDGFTDLCPSNKVALNAVKSQRTKWFWIPEMLNYDSFEFHHCVLLCLLLEPRTFVCCLVTKVSGMERCEAWKSTNPGFCQTSQTSVFFLKKTKNTPWECLLWELTWFHFHSMLSLYSFRGPFSWCFGPQRK